jgi:hypothetical protein
MAMIMEPDQIEGIDELHEYCASGEIGPPPDVTGDDLDNAGNGVCEIASTALASCETMGEVDMTADNIDEVCAHPCIQEAIDCIDNPVLASNYADIARFRTACESTQSECMGILLELGDAFDTVCGVGSSGEMPSVCSQDCANFFVPIWDQCGDTITGMTGNQEVATFEAKCPMPSGGTPPPPPACADDPTGVLTGMGYTCAAAVAAVGCDIDLSTAGVPGVPAGTSLNLVCPVTCGVCGH